MYVYLRISWIIISTIFFYQNHFEYIIFSNKLKKYNILKIKKYNFLL